MSNTNPRERATQILAFAREEQPGENEPTKLAAWRDAQKIAAGYQEVAALSRLKRLRHMPRLFDETNAFFTKYGL